MVRSSPYNFVTQRGHNITFHHFQRVASVKSFWKNWDFYIKKKKKEVEKNILLSANRDQLCICTSTPHTLMGKAPSLTTIFF